MLNHQVIRKSQKFKEAVDEMLPSEIPTVTETRDNGRNKAGYRTSEEANII